MFDKIVCIFVFCNIIGFITSQNADSTAAPVDTPKNETNSPTNVTIIPTTKIRDTCQIKSDVIDCSYRNITSFFTTADWLGIKDENLTKVDLSGNLIEHISAFPALNIRMLNLSRCNINRIDKSSFKFLQNITSLDLSYNNLTTEELNPHVFEGQYQPSEYEPLVNLRALDLSCNQLHSLNQDVFEHIPELTELRVSGNTMGMIDHVTMVAIASLPMLKILQMSRCGFVDIPDGFLHTLRKLEYLDLSGNELKRVPDALGEAKNVRYLNLNSNPIYRIDKGSSDYPPFPDLPSLQELHMCNMTKLKYVSDEGFGAVPNLKILYMNNNENLEYLGSKALAATDETGDKFVWPDLDELHLQNSNIKGLDRIFVENWDDLEVIDLGFNPLLCDCTTQWMLDYLVPMMEKKNASSTSNLICQQPEEMKSKTFHDLSQSKYKMRCLDKHNGRPERDGALLIGTLIGVLLSVPIILAVLLLWRRGYFACCGVKGPADYSRAFYKRAQTEDLHM